MFPVKGWSVTAPLKTQTGPVTVPTLTSSNGAKTSEKSSKKRKRKDGEVEDVRPKKAKPEKEVKQKKSGANKVEVDTERRQDRKDKKKKKDKKLEIAPNETLALEKKSKKEKAEKAPLVTVKSYKPTGQLKDRTAEKDKKQKSERKESEHGADADEPPNKHKKEDKRTPLPSQEQKLSEDLNGKTGRKRAKRSKKAENEQEPLDLATNSESPAPNSKSQKEDPQNVQPITVLLPTTSKLTPLQASMQAKLASARFRHLNETLYTSASDKALDLFKKSPSTFEEYHSGFRQQVDVWPENPVDAYISDIKRRGAIKWNGKDSTTTAKGAAKPLARTHGTCTIADLGCGDAKLAATLQQKTCLNLNVKVLSFDLHSPSPLVQRADIANLPLEDGGVNIAIFCLALMGTNWPDFIDEAYRILHWKGELWVAEIKSRFGRVEKNAGKGKVVEHSVGNKKKKPRSKMSDAERKKLDQLERDEDDTLAVEVDGATSKASDETDVSSFIKVLASRGFVLDGEEKEALDRSNKMFVKMRFLKAGQPTKGKNVAKGKEGTTWKPKGKKFVDEMVGDVDEEKVLKPCVYKLR